MILSDRDISEAMASGRLKIEGCRGIGPASVDVYLGDSFDCSPADAMDGEEWGGPPRSVKLFARGFMLGTTVEVVTLPDDIMGNVHGCSSIGRTGLFVQNAGLIDPGFSGQITLELFNASAAGMILCPGQRIAQLSFSYLNTPAKRPYSGRYMNQRGATAARPPLS